MEESERAQAARAQAVAAVVAKIKAAVERRVAQAKAASSAQAIWMTRQELLGSRLTERERERCRKVMREFDRSLASLKTEEDALWASLAGLVES